MAQEVLLMCQCKDYTDAYLLRDGTVQPWEAGWEYINGKWYCPSCAKQMTP